MVLVVTQLRANLRRKGGGSEAEMFAVEKENEDEESTRAFVLIELDIKKKRIWLAGLQRARNPTWAEAMSASSHRISTRLA